MYSIVIKFVYPASKTSKTMLYKESYNIIICQTLKNKKEPETWMIIIIFHTLSVVVLKVS